MNQRNIQHEYCPSRFLDTLMQYLHIHGDHALSKRLKISCRMIKDIRSGKYPIAGSLLMCIEEATGIAIAELRQWMGDRRAKYRLSGRSGCA